MVSTGFNLILTAVCLNITCPSFTVIVDDENSTNSTMEEANLNDTNNDFNLALNFNSEAIKNKTIRHYKHLINGKHLSIGTIEDPPLSYTEMENGTLVGKGVAFTLINLIAKKLNFTYTINVPKQNVLGSDFDLTESLLEEVNSTKVDIGAAFVPLLKLPTKFIQYSAVSLDEGEWMMVMRRPPESASGTGLLAPFEFWVWILILVSLLAVGPIIYFLIIIRNKITGDDSQKPYSLSHCAWFVYGALMKQGSTLSPIADSTRLLFATWWIFITILTSFYTANLTAFLTLSQFTLPIKTIEDIRIKSKHFVALRGSGIEYSIKNSGESLTSLQSMITKNLAVFTPNLNDSETLIDYVERKDYVYIRDRPAIDHTLYVDYQYRKTISWNNEKIHCPFAVSTDAAMKQTRAFIYPQNSKWSSLFDQELLNLVEAGIVQHLIDKNKPNAEICPQNLGGNERQLRNGDLMMTYYIMAAGFASASVTFMTELIFRFLNERRARQNPHYFSAVKKKTVSSKKMLYHNPHTIKTNGRTTNSPFAVKNKTPPPPYGSIFNASRDVMMNINHVKEGYIANARPGIKKFINGRDYIVFRGNNGENTLVPLRAPSATLFQYTYTK